MANAVPQPHPARSKQPVLGPLIPINRRRFLQLQTDHSYQRGVSTSSRIAGMNDLLQEQRRLRLSKKVTLRALRSISAPLNDGTNPFGQSAHQRPLEFDDSSSSGDESRLQLRVASTVAHKHRAQQLQTIQDTKRVRKVGSPRNGGNNQFDDPTDEEEENPYSQAVQWKSTTPLPLLPDPSRIIWAYNKAKEEEAAVLENMKRDVFRALSAARGSTWEGKESGVNRSSLSVEDRLDRKVKEKLSNQPRALKGLDEVRLTKAPASSALANSSPTRGLEAQSHASQVETELAKSQHSSHRSTAPTPKPDGNPQGPAKSATTKTRERGKESLHWSDLDSTLRSNGHESRGSVSITPTDKGSTRGRASLVGSSPFRQASQSGKSPTKRSKSRASLSVTPTADGRSAWRKLKHLRYRPDPTSLVTFVNGEVVVQSTCDYELPNAGPLLKQILEQYQRMDDRRINCVHFDDMVRFTEVLKLMPLPISWYGWRIRERASSVVTFGRYLLVMVPAAPLELLDRLVRKYLVPTEAASAFPSSTILNGAPYSPQELQDDEHYAALFDAFYTRFIPQWPDVLGFRKPEGALNRIYELFQRFCRGDPRGVDFKGFVRQFRATLDYDHLVSAFNQNDTDRDGFLQFEEYTKLLWLGFERSEQIVSEAELAKWKLEDQILTQPFHEICELKELPGDFLVKPRGSKRSTESRPPMEKITLATGKAAMNAPDRATGLESSTIATELPGDELVLANDADMSEGPKVVYLGLVPYLQHVLCRPKQVRGEFDGAEGEGIEKNKDIYRLRLSLDLPPRFWLLFNAAVVFILVSISIMVLMSLLWLQNASAREAQILRQFHQSISLVMESMTENTLSLSGKDLLDQAVTFTRWLEREKDHAYDDLTNRLMEDHYRDRTQIQQLIPFVVARCMSEMRGGLSEAAWHSTRATGGAGIGVPFLRGLMQKWRNRHPEWQLFLVNTTLSPSSNDSTRVLWPIQPGSLGLSTVAYPTSCDPLFTLAGTGAAPDGLAGMPSTADTLLVNDTTLVQLLPNDSVGICLFLSRMDAQAKVTAALVEKIDKVNSIALSLVREQEHSSEFIEMGLYGLSGTKDRLGAYSRARQTKRTALLSACAPVIEGLTSEPKNCTASDLLLNQYWQVATDLSRGQSPTTQLLPPVLNRSNNYFAYLANDFPHYNLGTGMAMLSYLPQLDRIIFHQVSTSAFVEDFRSQLLRIVNNINVVQTESTVEIVVTGPSADGMKLIPQLTALKFPDTCVKECKRVPESVVPMLSNFRRQGEAYATYTDYRPAPVVSGMSFLKQGLNRSIEVERDVTELRAASLRGAIRGLDAINAAMVDSTEGMIFRKQGMPSSVTYDPFEPCPRGVICQTYNDVGTVARTDCGECLPDPQLPPTPEYLTKVRFPENCFCNASSSQLPGANQEIFMEGLGHRSAATEALPTSMLDYTGRPVMSFVSFLAPLSSYFLLKRNTDDITSPILRSILTMVGVAIVLVFFGVVGLVIMSRKTIQSVESDWNKYKASVDQEKVKVEAMIRDVIPGSVLALYSQGQKSIAETLPAVSYAYLDICAFSERMRGQPPRTVVQTIGYYHMMYHLVGKSFHLFKLKAFGDVCVYCSASETKVKEEALGLGKREGEHPSQPKQDPVASKSAMAASTTTGLSSQPEGGVATAGDSVSGLTSTLIPLSGPEGASAVASFTACILYLVSKRFVHFPQKFHHLSTTRAEVGAGATTDPMPMLPVRIGLHTGPVYAGLVDVGHTPVYEHYGPTLAIAHRLQATCFPNRAHASESFKDCLEAPTLNPLHSGKGTIMSYPIRSVDFHVAEGLLSSMKVWHAQSMFSFSRKEGEFVESVTKSTTASTMTGTQVGKDTSSQSQRGARHR